MGEHLPVGCPRILNTNLRQIIVISVLAAAVSVLYFSVVLIRNKYGRLSKDKKFQRYLARVTDVEATDTDNPNVNYGIVVDCGSSGSRIFVYCWPRHNGNPHDLLDIRQMRDKNRKPVVMKIKPGISEFATSPEKVSDYISPLLTFAAEHVPRAKHIETPLYILCTAGMRVLPESQQEAILEDLLTDIPLHFDFLFSDSHAEVISGKQEGVYAWIGINFVLGRFEHIEEDDEAVVEVNVPGSESSEAIFRKRTAGILDMGGLSTQIAYEVPKTVSFVSSQQEEVAKNLLAEFNLGCDVHQTEHVYRVYVATFLGFGGNAARQRYEERLFANMVQKNRLLGKQTGLSPDTPYLDPCLPLDIKDEILQNGQTLYLRGTGDFDLCRETLQPFMNKTNETQTSLNGVYQPPIHFQNSEFYGFSEFYYCTEDVLRMGGDYNAATFTKAAKDYCATKWSILQERFDRGLYASHADLHRLKYQCFKSAWMFEVFHRGFSFPVTYKNLKTALQVYDKERHPAGVVPGQPRTLAGRVLCLQPLPVLWLLLGGPAVHPPLPAPPAPHPQEGTPQRCSVDGGRPALPEGAWSLVSHCVCSRKTPQEKPFLLRVSLYGPMVSFHSSLSVKPTVTSAVLGTTVLNTALNVGEGKKETHLTCACCTGYLPKVRCFWLSLRYAPFSSLMQEGTGKLFYVSISGTRG